MSSATGATLETNVAKAEQYLARFRANGVLHFIDGAPRVAQSGRTFETHTPIDGQVLAPVAAGDAADVAAAAEAAQRAFPTWRDLPGGDRRNLLHAIADAAIVSSRHRVSPVLTSTISIPRDLSAR